MFFTNFRLLSIYRSAIADEYTDISWNKGNQGNSRESKLIFPPHKKQHLHRPSTEELLALKKQHDDLQNYKQA